MRDMGNKVLPSLSPLAVAILSWHKLWVQSQLSHWDSRKEQAMWAAKDVIWLGRMCSHLWTTWPEASQKKPNRSQNPTTFLQEITLLLRQEEEGTEQNSVPGRGENLFGCFWLGRGEAVKQLRRGNARCEVGAALQADV